MAIPAKRFQFLDNETNVAVADFLATKDKSILNSPNLETPEIDDDMRSFFGQLTQSTSTASSSSTDNLVRQTKGAYGSFQSLGTLSAKDAQSKVSELLPDSPVAQNAFKQLSSSCQSNSQSRHSSMKPYDSKISCGSKSRIGKSSGGCAPNSFNDLLNKLTGGAYGGSVSDLNRTLQNLLNLVGMGYSMNMCGVFGALSTGIDTNVLSRASGLLLGELGSTKNTLGVFDLAGSSTGLATLRENPSGISNFLNQYTNPSEIKENGYSDLGDRLTGSLELLDENWDRSSYDGALSAAFSSDYSSDLDRLFSAKSAEKTISEDTLDSVVDSDMDFMAMAYKSKKDSFSIQSLFS